METPGTWREAGSGRGRVIYFVAQKRCFVGFLFTDLV